VQRHVAGRGLVGDGVRQLVRGGVGERHAHVLGLGPVDQVAEDPALGDLRHVALQDVQVGAADGDRVRPYDRVGGVDQVGVRASFQERLPGPW